MKQLFLLLAIGPLLAPAASSALPVPADTLIQEAIPENDGLGRGIIPFAAQSIPEATSGFRLPVNTISTYGNHFNVWDDIYCLSYSPPGAFHPGVDLNSLGSCDDDRGTDILAVANGRVVYVDVSNWGGMVIQHNWKGETWYSQYGHINAPLVAVGNDVVKGQHIAEMSDVGTTCVHLHWEIREADHPNPTVGDYWTCSVLRSSSSVANYYEDPEAFVASHGAYSTTPAYQCQYANQYVNGVDINEAYGTPGTIFTLAVAYTNTGTATWQNTGGQSNQNYVELESVTYPGGVVTDSWFDPVGWISGRQRVVSCTPASVATNAIATFTFQAQIPVSKAVADYQVYFRPYHGTTGMDDWGGMYFLVHVLAPSPPTNLSVDPSGCSEANSFTVNWTTPDDPGGIAGYEWQVDGTSSPSPVTTMPMTIAAPSAGNHTFYVRAYNLVGNRGSFASIDFCYQPATGPCPGREISHSPCRQPGDPCLPAMASNLQSLPDLTATQWQSVGRPVRELLQAGQTYSIGFEYRSTAAAEIKLGLGTFNPTTSNLGLVVSQCALPVSPNEWHPFWSAPFTVTADQLRDSPSLRFIRSRRVDDGMEVRKVRILSVR